MTKLKDYEVSLVQTRQDLEKIFADDETRKEWLDSFFNIGSDYDSAINQATERYIYNVFWVQGYWSFLTANLYWTKEESFFVKPRTFGKLSQ